MPWSLLAGALLSFAAAAGVAFGWRDEMDSRREQSMASTTNGLLLDHGRE